MSRHHHHDHDHDKPADKWTNIAAVGEASASLISDGYWFASLFDIASGLKVDFIGLSYWGFGVGIAMGLLTAGGAMYCHRALNTYHQQTEEHGDDYAREHLTSTAQGINDQVQVPTHFNMNSKLTWFQVAALICDGASHAGDIVGPMTFVVNLATANSLPRWEKGLVQVVSTVFGGVCSVASVRSCRDSIIKSNQLKLAKKNEESYLLNNGNNLPGPKSN